jgi:hypothetical protein
MATAHATGNDALHAANEAADRLKRQMRRVADAPVALRNDRRTIQHALANLAHDHKHRPRPSFKRPDLRDVIPQRAPYPLPESTLDAVADLLDLDLEFQLFRHARTEEDVVVYRRDDPRIGLLHPPGSPLAGENDIVVPRPSRYSRPIPLARGRDEMDVLNHRFLYFVDAADGRGKVLYLRHDGDHGLVELHRVASNPGVRLSGTPVPVVATPSERLRAIAEELDRTWERFGSALGGWPVTADTKQRSLRTSTSIRISGPRRRLTSRVRTSSRERSYRRTGAAAFVKALKTDMKPILPRSSAARPRKRAPRQARYARVKPSRRVVLVVAVGHQVDTEGGGQRVRGGHHLEYADVRADRREDRGHLVNRRAGVERRGYLQHV